MVGGLKTWAKACTNHPNVYNKDMANSDITTLIKMAMGKPEYNNLSKAIFITANVLGDTTEHVERVYRDSLILDELIYEAMQVPVPLISSRNSIDNNLVDIAF